MKRGEIWAAQADLYASKVRPVLIVQSDAVVAYGSIITCLITSFEQAEDELRLKIEPTRNNGLATTSYLMFDKLFSFDKEDLGKKIGILSKAEMIEVDKRLRIVLGL